jgi:hypothetical protein
MTMLEFTDKKVGEMSVIIDITEEDIENIIVTALEGGSNYWLGLDKKCPAVQGKPENEPWSTWVTKILLDGGTVRLYDVEDSEEVWELTLPKLLKGIQHNTERSGAGDKDCWDAIDTDCIVQYAIFGKLVYG